MSRHLAVLLALFVALTLFGCGSDASQQDDDTAADSSTDAGDDASTDATDMDADVEPVWTMPTVEGLPTAEDINPDEDIVEINLTASTTMVDVGQDLTLEMMTYNGTYPGPTINAKVGDEVIVHFTNALEEPTTIHWHGLRISDEMDGNPRIQNPIQPGESFEYRFVVPEAGTFWYHPHVRANEQVERGLYGGFIVHDPLDVEYDVERLVIVDDMLLDGDEFAPFLNSHPELMHGRSGNVLSVNGRIDAVSAPSTKGNVERWRFINTANARTFTLQLNGRSRIIATDGGRLAAAFSKPVFQMPVGQRYDLEVFIDEPGETTVDARIQVLDANNNIVTESFELFGVDAEDSIAITYARPVPEHILPLEDRPIDRNEEIVLNVMEGGEHGVMWTINGQAHSEEPLFTFEKGEVVHFTIRNEAGPEHPFHLHGQFFQVVSHNEPGLKDTVLVPGLETVEIVAWMDNPGQWMAHCHILEHAELGMMSEIIVNP